VNRFSTRSILLLLGFSFLGFLVMGYHPGAEDDGVYLTAVKSDLNPDLYPHDSSFFKLQLETTIFDTSMATFVHATGMPIGIAELLWQALSVFQLCPTPTTTLSSFTVQAPNRAWKAYHREDCQYYMSSIDELARWNRIHRDQYTQHGQYKRRVKCFNGQRVSGSHRLSH